MINDHGIIIGKGINSGNHFINDDSQSPPIDGLAMALVLKNLWRQIFWSATKCESPVLDSFSKTEISKLDVTIGGDEHVFGFEVAVNDVLAVEVLEDEDQLGCIECGLVRFENAFFSEMGEELSARDVFHEEVNVFAVLVHAFEVDDEWVADRFQDLVLVTDVVHLLRLN